MVDPNNIFAFLDITGEWDPILAFVMGGALLVFAPFYHMLIKPRVKAIDGQEISVPSNNAIDPKLIIGAVLFGLGWGIGGICPGPAVASLGEMSTTIMTFIVAMLVGMKVVTLAQKKNS